MFTYQVFKSPDVEIDYQHDFYSLKAKDDLPVGHMVLIEHVLWGDINLMVNGVARDDKLFASLYPRPSESVGCAEQLLADKTTSNIFMFGGTYVLGDAISKFNHSCVPNCHLVIVDHFGNNQFYGVWTHRKVKKGDQLTFDYINKGSIDFHNKMKEIHNFSCECTDDYIVANEKRAEIHKNMGIHFRVREEHFIQRLVENYLDTCAGRDVSRAQACLRKLVKISIEQGDYKCI